MTPPPIQLHIIYDTDITIYDKQYIGNHGCPVEPLYLSQTLFKQGVLNVVYSQPTSSCDLDLIFIEVYSNNENVTISYNFLKCSYPPI